MVEKTGITIAIILTNLLLFVAKLYVGLLSNSLAVLSDAFNSLTDIVSSVGIHIAVHVSMQQADDGHPFGHHRAEPIAGLIVAIFAGILGFEIIRSAVGGFITKREQNLGLPVVYVLLFTMAVKSVMALYLLKKGRAINSPALTATGVDARNDVLVSLTALIGVVCSMYAMPILDSVTALIIGIFILYSGYHIGIENIDYLMGKSPPESFLAEIKAIIRQIEGVDGLNAVRAHYVGPFIHIEIHIEVDKSLSTEQSHAIGKRVQYAVEGLKQIDKAFIHIDPC
ncbi:MAG TPA: cation diffusion facilitator family transporter [Thermodesulfovibrionia bacterium]|nr:cation diffusion facilitator family transporter [Thermodesulfovibrionia bacterium]